MPSVDKRSPIARRLSTTLRRQCRSSRTVGKASAAHSDPGVFRGDHRAVGGRRAAPRLYAGQRCAGTGAPHDAEFQELVAEELSFIEAFSPPLRRCWSEGRHNCGRSPGERIGQTAPERADRRVRVLARTRPERVVLEGAANSVLALLGAGVRPRPSAKSRRTIASTTRHPYLVAIAQAREQRQSDRRL